jgi:RNA polymerase sigma-70 factor (ECF subfamily)
VEIAAALPRLRALARRLAGSGDDAEDLVQRTAVRSIEYSGTFTPGTDLDGWLRVILRRLWFSDCRRADRGRLSVLTPAVLGTAVDGGQELRVLLRETERAAASLPATLRAALAMARDGHSMADAAARSAVPLGTAKSRLSRARALLRARGLTFHRS